MALLNELFGSFEGQLSFLVLLTVIGMAVFFVRMFIKKMDNKE